MKLLKKLFIVVAGVMLLVGQSDASAMDSQGIYLHQVAARIVHDANEDYDAAVVAADRACEALRAAFANSCGVQNAQDAYLRAKKRQKKAYAALNAAKKYLDNVS